MSIAATEPAQPRTRMPAVRNCIAVLRALGSTTSPVSAGALARSLDIPRSTTYQLLQVLVDEGLAVHVPGAAGYTLGDGVFELGSAYSRRSSLANLAQPLLSRLSQAIGETATLAILHGTDVLYLAKEQPPRPVPVASEPGVQLPSHLTASGRALLAGLPRREVLAYFSDSKAFSTLNGSGPRSLRELREVLAGDAARGWSLEGDTVMEGVTCLSAAAYDRHGRPTAAVTASFPTRRGEGRLPLITREVVRTADELTRRMGGQVPQRDESGTPSATTDSRALHAR